MRWSALGAAAIALSARPAGAFLGNEHQAIGWEAYVTACQRLLAEAPGVGPTALGAVATDAARAARLTLACGAVAEPGRNEVERMRLQDRARIYGQAVSLAGDLLGTPEQFFSAVGGRNVTSKKNYLLLALVNSAHFHPESVRRWREYHADSISEALNAGRNLVGAAQTTAFEHATYLHAFADHFLEDSFAAGHLGFNRPASSASASYVFHNWFNDRGRVMFNARGNVWIGYGDGLLDAEKNTRNRALVVEANTSSVLAFLRAFVDGRIDGSEERQVELIFPAACYAVRWPGYVVPILRRYLDPDTLALDDVRAQIEAVASDEQRRAIGRAAWRGPPQPGAESNDDVLRQLTRALNDRAYKDVGFDVGWFYGGENITDAPNLQAVLGSLRLRAFENGIRFEAYVGMTYEPHVDVVYGPGLSWQLGSSFKGLLTHDLAASVFGHLTCATCLGELVGVAGYRLNLEAGRYVLGFQIYPAAVDVRGNWAFGWLVGVGLEVLASASGGGPL